MLKKISLMVATVALSGTALAGGSIDVALSDQSIRAEHGAARVGTGAYITVGGWYRQDAGSMLSGGFHAIDPSNQRPELIGGIGGKGFLFKVPEENTSVAIGLGGFLRYNPPQLNGVGAEVSAYYSPPVLAFGDLAQFYDVQARLTYLVLPQARIFVGYSDSRATYERERTLDSTITIGFRVRY